MAYYLTWFLLACIYAPVFYDLYLVRWESIDYTHAYFILPFSLYLSWQKKQQLHEAYAQFKPRASDAAGLVVALAGLLLFIFGWRQGYLFISSLSLIPVLWGVIRYMFGAKVLRILTFPLLYLFMLVPPPLSVLDALTIPMRYGASWATAGILGIAGYPVERSGLLLNMQGHEIFLGAPCSGFRSLITMIALALVYVYTRKGSFQKKSILVLSVIPFALFGNCVRVITLCLITFYAGKEAAEGFFHYFSGVVIFIIMIGCMMVLEYLLDRPLTKGSAA